MAFVRVTPGGAHWGGRGVGGLRTQLQYSACCDTVLTSILHQKAQQHVHMCVYIYLFMYVQHNCTLASRSVQRTLVPLHKHRCDCKVINQIVFSLLIEITHYALTHFCVFSGCSLWVLCCMASCKKFLFSPLHFAYATTRSRAFYHYQVLFLCCHSPIFQLTF